MSEEPSEPQGEPSPEPEPTPKPKPEPKTSDTWDSLKDIAKIIGTWAWLIGLINGSIGVLVGLVNLITAGIFSGITGLSFSTLITTSTYVWYIIGGAVTIVLSLVIVLPRFSNKCKNEDWEFLLNDVLVLGSFRFPLMLLWGALLSIFGFYVWGGVGVLVPAFMLLFAGPEPYEWTE
ncbi:MAG: hypothetical protein EU541_03840 [Promethearchaeota archaeon]|nr:MAG: hypothetical protein EU541_03840 [Candidatus Lokiarchaeota archaeon]